MEKQIKLFNKLKDSFPDILLSGSCVLNKYGLLNREVKDLDIISNELDSKFINFIQSMEKISPCKKLVYYYSNENKEYEHYRFCLDEIDVCVFVYKHYDFQNKRGNIKNEIKVTEIIKAKQKYIDNWVIQRQSKNRHLKNPPKSIKKHIDDIEFYKKRQLEICRKFNEDREFISNVF